MEGLGIHILFPVLNERIRLEKGVETAVAYLKENITIPWCITILDNGSEDETPEIGRMLAQKYQEVSYERVEVRGVGAAFRKGVELNHCSLVGYMDIDLSTDIRHLSEAIELFHKRSELEYINGTRFSRQSNTMGRKWYRKITSKGLVTLLKLIFHMKATDAICGFTFLRKEAAESLVEESSNDNGWFFMIEILLRAERRGMEIYDMPVEWTEDYNTTVKIFKTIKNYLIQIHRLKKTFRNELRREHHD